MRKENFFKFNNEFTENTKHIFLFLLIGLLTISSNAQSSPNDEGAVSARWSNSYLHSVPSCGTQSKAGKIDWSENPINLNEFSWTPNGSLTNTLIDVSGTGVDVTIAFSGDVYALGYWDYEQTPSIGTGNGHESLQYYSDCNGAGININISFSEPIDAVGFDLTHINFYNYRGDKYIITANTTQGNVIYPRFSVGDYPSFTTNNFGEVNAFVYNEYVDSACYSDREVGVNFYSDEKITSINLLWQDCESCCNSGHGSGIWDIDFCLKKPLINVVDDVAATNENTQVVIPIYNNDLNLPTEGVLTITNPVNGIVNIDNNGTLTNPNDDIITYTPNTGFTGTDTFTYTICDVAQNCDTAIVTIDVYKDTDGDNFADIEDLDDDNDGILDSVECSAAVFSSFNTLNTSFNVTGTGSANSAIVNSITVDGNVFSDYIFPNSYEEHFSSTNKNHFFEAYHLELGKIQGNSNYGNNIENPSWNSIILPAFRSNDLNYFQRQEGGVVPGDYYLLKYDVPILVSEGAFLMISEQGGNNNTSIEALDVNGNSLGTPVQLLGGSSNYLPTGAYTQTGQQIKIAVYNLTDFSSVGDLIATIKLGSETPNSDGPDGKVFIVPNQESCQDSDGDGIPNYLDLDSDNDGISDVVETGGLDANHDGMADGNVGTTLTTRGIPSSAGTGNAPLNSDSDILSSYLDIDADNDGIPDNIEAQTTANWIAPSGVGLAMVDVNKNGLDDNYESNGNIGLIPNDHDGIDTIPDYIDTDSDNDGILDKVENGSALNSVSGVDTDNDGLDDAWDDVDDSAYDGATVNDNHNPPSASNLGDEDGDLNSGGDVDFRDDTLFRVVDDNTSTLEDAPVVILIYNNDNDIPTEGILTITNPANGIVVVTDPNNTPNNPSDDIVTYTPNPNFNGEDTFNYTVCDSAAPPNCETAAVTITVVPVVDVTDDEGATEQNTPININIYNNDNDIPANGTLTLTNPVNGIVTIDNNGTPNDPSDDVVTYTPNQNFTGVDTFEYTICNNSVPQICRTATVIVNVSGFQDFAPVIFLGNSVVIGSSGVVDFRVLVGEYGNGNSNGVTPVELRIIKNPELIVSFDNTLTSLNGQPVSNSQWQYDGSHPALHKFIYIGNGGVFLANTAKILGINAVYHPSSNSNGTFPIKATIKFFSGGEINNSNNNDIDFIEYHNN